MHFDLIDSGEHSRLRVQKLLKLEMVSMFSWSVSSFPPAYMLDPVIADAARLHLSISNGILDGFP